MRDAFVSFILLVLIAMVAVRAQTAPATSATTLPAAADSTESLVGQLGDPQWAVRQAAQEKLVAKADDSVIARLRRAAAESDSDEVRQRAESALAEIEQRRVTGASLITLHLKNAQVRDAFAELSRQAGSSLVPMPPELWSLKTWPTISIDAEREPFWSVLRTIGAQAGVELRQWNDGLRLMQSGARGQAGGRFVVSGPFLITLVRCSRTQVIEYGQPGGENPRSDFAIFFSAMAEPKLRVLRAAYAAKLEEATDDRGNSLSPQPADDDANAGMAIAPNPNADPSRMLEATFVTGAGGVWQFSSHLLYPPNIGKRLVTLRGSVNVLLQTRVETMEIPGVLSAVKMSRVAGGLRLTVNDARRVGADRYDLNLTIARDDSGTPIEWDRVQQSVNEMKLLDAQGRPMTRSNLSLGTGNETVELTLSFTRPPDALRVRNARPDAAAAPNGAAPNGAAPADPVKLLWTVPTETKEVTVPFEFKDVPLPE